MLANIYVRHYFKYLGYTHEQNRKNVCYHRAYILVREKYILQGNCGYLVDNKMLLFSQPIKMPGILGTFLYCCKLDAQIFLNSVK